MVDIDERVVQMKFDSSDFEQKSKTTLSILDKLREKLSFKDTMDDNSISAIADNVQKMADKAYTIVDRMIDKIKDNIANKLLSFLQENTIGQFKSGFDKYADMTTSVATLKSQGYELNKITEQLEKLNFYTDETSYSFTDMVREIGKFTASGQSLENATEAMMGIANWAALSGKNAGEASRAMYQLSQALGAGKIRKEDWKSIQNLNMDTKEFRENAIQAAIEFGTLKETAEGTYTSLVGKKANKLSFNVQQFAENLTEGEWFTADVMMKVFNQYSEAVDEIYDLYNEANENSDTEITASTIIRNVKENNKKLIKEFEKTGLSTKDINKVLASWKKVEKVTDETVDNYAAINKMSKDDAFKEMSSNYEKYLSEYSTLFTDSEQDAEEALDRWQSYVSEFGLKALSAAQEARTFRDAIDSAKDAASSVWTQVYTAIFGNYDEAKELWTDLANALYDIFVARLWKISDIFNYWKTGFEEEREEELNRLETEYEALIEKNRSGGLIEHERKRLDVLETEIQQITDEINTGLLNGRRVLFQGIYALGSGFKSILENFRDAWDATFEENETAQKLFTFSERLRMSAFKFYMFMKELGETDFYKNIAEGIRNLLSPITAIKNIIKSVIGQFLPDGESARDVLVRLSESFKNLTEKIKPSEQTIKRIARILRGFVAVVKLVAKAIYGAYTTFIRPILSVAFDIIGELIGAILEIFARISDVIFGFEEAIGPMEAMEVITSTLGQALRLVAKAIKSVIGFIMQLLVPVLRKVYTLVKGIFLEILNFLSNDEGNVFENIANGLKDIGIRAKEAWTSTETLGDVFNRFRGGSGLGNFINMLGAMFDNLVTRIGRVIGAIFGFNKVLSDDSGESAFSKLKKAAYEVFQVLGWLWTNLIRPILAGVFQGIAAMSEEIGEAWKAGDIMKILDIIGRTFKTLGLFQFWKVLQALSRTFGSAGILKVLRNAAKALNSISRYFGAKALNETSGALLKIVLGFSVLLGVLVAITYLPQENIETLGDLLFRAGIAMAVMVASMTTLSLVATQTRWGLVGIATSMFAMIAAVWTFIFVINKINQAILDFKDNIGANTASAIIGAILPIVGIIAAMIIVFRIAARIGNSGGLIAFGAGVAALGIACLALVFALDNIVDFFRGVTVQEAIAAITALIVLMTAVAVASGIMIRLMGNSLRNIKHMAGAAAAGISIAVMVITTALIVVPLLEDMVQHANKFPQYLQALAIFALTILAVSSAFALMTSRTRGGFHLLAAGIVFNMFANTIKNIIIPLVLSLEDLRLEQYLPAVLLIAALTISLSYGIRLIFQGIAEIVDSLSKLKTSSWIGIILSTGAVIAGLFILIHIFEDFGEGPDWSVMLITIGTVISIVTIFGIFARVLGRMVQDNYLVADSLVSIFNSMSTFIIGLMAGLILLVATIKFFYKDQNGIYDAMTIMSAFTIAIIAFVGISLFMLSKAISSIGPVLKTLDENQLNTIKRLLLMTFISIAGIMIILTACAAVVKSFYDNSTGYLGSFTTIVVATLLILAGVFAGVIIFAKQVSNENFNGKALAAVIVSLGTVIASLALMGTLVIPALEDIRFIDSDKIIATFGGIALVIASVLGMAALLAKTSGPDSLGTVIAGIVGVILTLITMVALLPELFKCFDDVKGSTTGDVVRYLVIMLGPLAALVGLVTVFATKGLGEGFILAATKIAAGLGIIALAIAAVSTAMALFREVFSPGTSFISGYFNIKGKADGYRAGAEEYYDAIEETDKKGQKISDEIEKRSSPSKWWKQAGKYNVQGLAMGMKQNQKLAVNASKGLAIATDEAFCDELGIESPSKVFYENGRFIVRGFINGVNAESNKNKQAGLDMAEGFSEGMDEAMESIKDDFAGLWMGLDEDSVISEAVKNSGSGIADLFTESLFGNTEPLTEEEIKSLEEYKNKRDAILNEALSSNKNYKNEYAHLTEQIASLEEKNRSSGLNENERKALDEYKKRLEVLRNQASEEIAKNNPEYKSYIEQIAELESRNANAGKGKLETLFSGTIGDVLNDLMGDTTIKEKLGTFGEWVGGGIASVFSEDSEWYNKLKDKGKELLGKFGIDITGEGENGEKSPGTQIGEQILGGIFDAFGTDENTAKITEMASTLGSKAGWSFYDSFTGWVQDALDYFSGTEEENRIKVGNANTLKDFAEDKKLDSATDPFFDLMRIAMRNSPKTTVTYEMVNDLYNAYKEISKSQHVNKIDLEKAFNGGYLFESYLDKVTDENGNINYGLIAGSGINPFVDIGIIKDLAFGNGDLQNPKFTAENAIISTDKGTIETKDLVPNVLSSENIIDETELQTFKKELANLGYEFEDGEDLRAAYLEALARGIVVHNTPEKTNAYSEIQDTTLTAGISLLLPGLSLASMGFRNLNSELEDSNGELDESSENYKTFVAYIEALNNLGITFKKKKSGVKELSKEEKEINEMSQRVSNNLQYYIKSGNRSALDNWETDAKKAYDGIIDYLKNADPYEQASEKYQQWLADAEIYEKAYGWTETLLLSTINGVTTAISNTSTLTSDIYARAQAAGGIDNLKSLSQKARSNDPYASKELDRLTNGLGYDKFIKSITSRYDNLQTFMKNATSADYLNGNFNKWYDEAKYYEKYYGAGEEAYNQSLKEVASKYEKETGKVIKDINPFSTLFKSVMTALPEVGIDKMYEFFLLGMEQEWIKIDENGKLWAATFSDDILETIKKKWRINSPSEESADLTKYFMLGLDVGILENAKNVLTDMHNITDAIGDEVSDGLQSMVETVDQYDVGSLLQPLADNGFLDSLNETVVDKIPILGNILSGALNKIDKGMEIVNTASDWATNGMPISYLGKGLDLLGNATEGKDFGNAGEAIFEGSANLIGGLLYPLFKDPAVINAIEEQQRKKELEEIGKIIDEDNSGFENFIHIASQHEHNLLAQIIESIFYSSEEEAEEITKNGIDFVSKWRKLTGYARLIQDMAEDDTINPMITPVYSDISDLGTAMTVSRVLSKTMQNVNNTKNSFSTSSPDYDSKLDTLANGIVGTNTLLQSLYETLQNGGLIDVNVIPEFDDTGLFNLVINKGKENWKRTGQQQFKW